MEKENHAQTILVKTDKPVVIKSFCSFIGQLEGKLKKPLPGQEAHRIMEASLASYLGVKPNEKTRRSAVLLLIYPVNDEVYFPLILRAAYDGVHSGQIAFPGGKYEQTDENLINTALREAQEEVGIRSDQVKILGTLTEIYIAPSNFLVLPVIGYLPCRPGFLANDREVEAILEVKLDYFCDTDIVKYSKILIPGDVVSTPYYELQGHKIWGATAKMIIELLVIVKGNL